MLLRGTVVADGSITTVDAEAVYRRARNRFEGRRWDG